MRYLYRKIFFLDKYKDKEKEDFNSSEIKELEYEVRQKSKFDVDYQNFFTYIK